MKFQKDHYNGERKKKVHVYVNNQSNNMIRISKLAFITFRELSLPIMLLYVKHTAEIRMYLFTTIIISSCANISRKC